MAKGELIRRHNNDKRAKTINREKWVFAIIWSLLIVLNLLTQDWLAAILSLNLLLMVLRLNTEQVLRLMADDVIEAQNEYIASLESGIDKATKMMELHIAKSKAKKATKKAKK